VQAAADDLTKRLPFRPFDRAHDVPQTQGPELAEGQPTQHFVAITENMHTLNFKVLGD
jgi:hypothetical protein